MIRDRIFFLHGTVWYVRPSQPQRRYPGETQYVRKQANVWFTMLDTLYVELKKTRGKWNEANPEDTQEGQNSCQRWKKKPKSDSMTYCRIEEGSHSSRLTATSVPLHQTRTGHLKCVLWFCGWSKVMEEYMATSFQSCRWFWQKSQHPSLLVRSWWYTCSLVNPTFVRCLSEPHSC